MSGFTRYRAAAIVALVVAGTLTAPGQAQAFVPDSPPCYGATCEGKSPYLTNRNGESCVSGVPGENNGAITLTYVDSPGDGVDGNRVYLRYSAFCAANWAKWEGSEPNLASFYAIAQGGAPEYSNGYYSAMVDGTKIAQACVYGYLSYGADPACTAWY